MLLLSCLPLELSAYFSHHCSLTTALRLAHFAEELSDKKLLHTWVGSSAEPALWVSFSISPTIVLQVASCAVSSSSIDVGSNDLIVTSIGMVDNEAQPLVWVISGEGEHASNISTLTVLTEG